MPTQILLEDKTKYLVHDKDGNGRLPYTDSSGNISHGRMGAAWAALHGGYRGNKYGGPDKTSAIARLKRIYASEKMDLPEQIGFSVGAFKSVLDRIATTLEDSGYSRNEAIVIGRTALAQPIAQEFTLHSADWLQEWIPGGEALLEDTWEELSAKVMSHARMSNVFPSEMGLWNDWAQCFGVYPPTAKAPGLIVVGDLDPQPNNSVMCANWEENADGDIVFSNARDISTCYESIATRQQENLSKAVVLVEALRAAIDAAEIAYLASAVEQKPFSVPALTLESRPPAQQAELVKYMRREGLISERFEDPQELPPVVFERHAAANHAIVKMAQAHRKVYARQRRATKSQANLIRPTLGMPMRVGAMGEQKLREIQSISFSTERFTIAEARKWARRFGFIADEPDESTTGIIRFEQYAVPNPKTKRKSIPLVLGVSGVACARGK